MFLKQSTASQEVLIGPFLDDTDGKTAETGLTIANTDIKIWKHGATTLANKNSGGATHISGGIYSMVLDATDTDTVGMMEIFVSISGALPCKKQPLQVVEEVIYDAYYADGATGLLPANVTQISGDTTAADTLELFAEALDQATGQLDSGSLAAGTLTEAAFASNFGDTGVTFPKMIEMVVAFVAGKVSRSSAAGVTTLTYKKRDGTTTSFTTVANEDDGDRDTTGSLS
jgi:hypothetical protein